MAVLWRASRSTSLSQCLSRGQGQSGMLGGSSSWPGGLCRHRSSGRIEAGGKTASCFETVVHRYQLGRYPHLSLVLGYRQSVPAALCPDGTAWEETSPVYPDRGRSSQPGLCMSVEGHSARDKGRKRDALIDRACTRSRRFSRVDRDGKRQALDQNDPMTFRRRRVVRFFSSSNWLATGERHP